MSVVFLLFGVLPIFIYGGIVSRTNFTSRVDARKIELQTKCLMLSNKLTRGNFLKNSDNREVIRSEIDAVADIYNGRIVIIDKSYTTIEDTFNLATGKDKYLSGNNRKHSTGKQYKIYT